MTNKKIFFIISIVIILSVNLILAGFYLQKISDVKEQELKNLYTKRQGLIMEQKKLEILVDDLNKTVIEIKANQENISKLIENRDVVISESNSNPTPSQPPVTSPPTPPEPDPTPPVTSAS